MSLLAYIDNEVPAFGEWDAVVQVGGNIQQTHPAAFPERGSCGLHAAADIGQTAFCRKDLAGFSLAPGGTLYLGVWIRRPASWTDFIHVAYLYLGGVMVARFFLNGNGLAQFGIFSDAGGAYGTNQISGAFESARWHYVVVKLTRATTNVSGDGQAELYLDGFWRTTTGNVDNYDRCAGTGLRLELGIVGSVDVNGAACYFDEVKLADAYPEPYVPVPEDEYPSARRTVVLYRPVSEDSKLFADYCVGELGVPRANLIALNSAGSGESLADYATFQSQVENPIAAYFALNPTVAANCMCFLLGHGVPGYFTHAGVKHSAASRLMRYGSAFSSGASNPFYAPSSVSRLTVSGLRSSGLYLASRIDADSLANAQGLVDRALGVSALDELADSDVLYGDDATYRASLPCQKLRVLTAALGTFADDGFVFGDTGTPAFGAGGTRAAFADDSADSADSLRSGSAACRQALFTAGYAAALGLSDDADDLDAESFFEMLRIGGTFAEAALVAAAKLDFTCVPAGSPLVTVPFREAGYNIYRGIGGAELIDYSQPVACARPGQETVSLVEDLPVGQRYVFAARGVSSKGLSEGNTHVLACVESDEEGVLLPAPLACPTELTADLLPDGDVLIGFTYDAPPGFAFPDAFDILTDHGTGSLDLEDPLATVEEVGEGQRDFESRVNRPEGSFLLAVRARKDSRAGPISQTLFVALPEAPAPPRTI